MYAQEECREAPEIKCTLINYINCHCINITYTLVNIVILYLRILTILLTMLLELYSICILRMFYISTIFYVYFITYILFIFTFYVFQNLFYFVWPTFSGQCAPGPGICKWSSGSEKRALMLYAGLFALTASGLTISYAPGPGTRTRSSVKTFCLPDIE